MLCLALVVSGLVSSFSSALGKPEPHRIPIAVSAPAAVVHDVESNSDFRVQPVKGLANARRAVKSRASYGALVFPLDGPHILLVANGAGHAVVAILDQLGQREVRLFGGTIRTLDIAPTSRNDPNGSIEFYCVVFVFLGSAVGASALRRVMGPGRQPRKAVEAFLVVLTYAALLSVAVALVVDVVYGALIGHFALLFLSLWLYSLAVCLAITGFAALVGGGPSILLVLLIVALGNPSSGGAVPPPLLNGFYSSLRPLLPQGAALSLLRGVQYFGNRGAAASLLCLLLWSLLGLGLLGAAGTRRWRTAVASSNIRTR